MPRIVAQLRADSGCCRDALMTWCETHAVDYVFGLATTAGLIARATISASVLLHGVERARDAAIRQRCSALVEGMLENVPVIPFDLAEASARARVWAERSAAGVLIGAHDLRIAATALVARSEVATLSVGEFSRVSGQTLAELTRVGLRQTAPAILRWCVTPERDSTTYRGAIVTPISAFVRSVRNGNSRPDPCGSRRMLNDRQC